MKIIRVLLLILACFSYLFVQNLVSQNGTDISAQHFPEGGVGNVVNLIFSSRVNLFKKIHEHLKEKNVENKLGKNKSDQLLKVKVKGKSLHLVNQNNKVIKVEPLPYYVKMNKDTQASLNDNTLAVTNLQKSETPEDFEIPLEQPTEAKE